MTRTMWTQLTTTSLLVVSMACAPTRETIYDDVRRQLADRAALNVDVRQLSLETRELDANVLGVLSENLTVDDAVKVSLLNNRNLQATFERLGVPHAALLQASLPQNPMIDAELRYKTLTLKRDYRKSVVGHSPTRLSCGYPCQAPAASLS
jgi:hypothetical protein